MIRLLLSIGMVGFLLNGAAAEEPQAPALDDRYFDSAGVKIRYVQAGEGDPVLLLHGLSRGIERSWVETGLLPWLAENKRVIAFDFRGYGKSYKPPEENAFGLHMVEDVTRLLDHLQIAKAHVVGHSLGGRIALKFAALHPERVSTLTLIGTGGARTCDDHKNWDIMAEAFRRGEGLAPVAWMMWPTDQPPPTEEQLDDINKRFMAGNDPNVLQAVVASFREFATSKEELAALKIPMLAIVGSVDAYRTEVDALREICPELKAVVIPGVSYGAVLERDETRAALSELLGI